MTLGVYLPSFWGGAAEARFGRCVFESLRRLWQEREYRLRMFIDDRPEGEQREPFDELARAVRDGEIRGLIVLRANDTDIEWLREMPLPLSFLSSGRVAQKVEFDVRQFFALALDRLRAQGCRSVGLVAAANAVKSKKEPGYVHPYSAYYDTYIELCRARGLEIRNEWIVSPDLQETSHELLGYAGFRRMWHQTSRPEGLIAFPDVTALGVARALEELGPEAPRPRLVFHCNRGMPLPFPPVRASWVYNDVAAVAALMVRQIEQQMAGVALEPAVVPYAITPDESLPYQGL